MKNTSTRFAGRLLGSVIILLFSVLVLGQGAQAQTTFTVTNTNDAGTGSLRQVMLDVMTSSSPAPFTITATVSGTINLASVLANITKDIAFIGPGANSLTVRRSSGGNYRIFNIPNNNTVSFTGFTIADGASASPGGGIASKGPLSVSNCILSNNTASVGGGVYGGAATSLTNCLLVGNSVSNAGGGVGAETDLNLTNCTFSNNTAGQGGGVYMNGGTGLFINATFSQNKSNAGGGVNIWQAATPTFTNCLIAGNTNADGTAPNDVFESGSISSSSAYNVIGAVVGNTQSLRNGVNNNQVGVNALLGGLGNYGGELPTYALLPGSPAINAGTASNAPATDARGVGRVGAPDAGSFESQGFSLVLTGGDSQSALTGMAFESPLTVSLSSANAEPVAGGVVTFTGPGTGASISPAFVTASIAGTTASVSVTANAAGGPYSVTASARGATSSVAFNLTNSSPSPIRYVKQGGTGSGSSWADASGDLQSQINFTGAQQVWVAAGIYKPTSTTARNVSFSLKNGVAVYGGFVGTETLLSQRPVGNPVIGSPSSSTLSGDIGVVGDNTDNSFHVINNSNLDRTAVLDGFLISGGNASGFGDSGGGMYNTNSSPSLSNCSFQNNSAVTGGGMYNRDNSSPDLANCTFRNNSARFGGGMYNDNGSPSLSNNIFQNNSASSFGGGMANYSNSSPGLSNCSFQNNSAIAGGGMYNLDSSPGLINCSFINNFATFNGGGVYNLESSSPSLTNCSFQNNSAASYGGGMYNLESSSPSLTNCSFQNNSAASYGGGMYNLDSSRPSLTNCSFINNSATYYGGGMYNFNSSPGLTNCSFQNNSATSNGGGMYNYGSSSNPLLTNCVLFGNGGSKTFYNSLSNPTTASYCLFDASVTGYTDGGNNTTTTTNPFASTSSTQLSNCSPAINAGDPASTTASSGTTDLAGNPRFYQGGRIDMGAYEYQGEPTTISVSSPATTTATQGAGFSQTFSAMGGGSPYSFSVASGTLPAGLSLAGATGVLSGTPTQSGSFSITVQATDANGCVGAGAVYSLTVNAAIPTIADLAASPAAVCVGSPVTFTATIGNLTGSYAYTLTNGSSTSLTGTTSTAFSQSLAASGSGTQSFTLTVSSNGQRATASTSLTITSSPDYQPLVDLYNATNGANWARKSGWLSGCDPCTGNGGQSWEGIGCTNGRVSQINLSNNNLTGSIPVSLSALTQLTYMNLSSNQLSGMIPTSLSALTQLTFIDFGNNQISGSIPTSLSALTQLAMLYLGNNQLSGPIAVLGTLPSLQDAQLNDNQLSGPVPPSLANLLQLQTLNLYNNQLSGCFPASLTALCGKDVLFTNNPGLPGGGNFDTFCQAPTPTASASTTTPTVSAGQTVSLSATGGAYYSWSGPTSFTANVASPSFVASSPTQSGTYSVTVSNGSCENNPVASVSVTVTCNPDYQPLVDLYNATNGANWSRKDGWLNGCDPCTGNGGQPWEGIGCTNGRVSQIDLFGNNVIGSIPASLSALTQLTYVNLDLNQLSGSIPSSLSALSQLTTLNLSRNQLSGPIAVLGTLTNLQTAFLNGNGFSGPVPASLANLTQLQTLNLYANQLSGCFPASLTALCGKDVLFGNNPGLPGGGDFDTFCQAPTPTASASTTTPTVSVGQTVSLSATGGAYYSWSGPASFTADVANPSFVVSSPTQSGTYSVTVSNGSCENNPVSSVNVTVNALPPTIAGLSPSPNTVCIGSPVTFTATVGNVTGSYAYTLTNGIGTSITGTTTSTAFSQSLTASGSGTQSFTLTVSSSGQTTSATTSLTVNPLPVAGLTNNGPLTCAQTSVTLTASGGTSYSFSTGATPIGTSNRATVTTAGTYSVTVINGVNGCSSVASTTVDQAATTRLTWTGQTSTDWNTAGNWCPARVPLSTDDVVIPATPPNKPVLGTNAVANSVEVQSGASLAITNAGILTLNGSKSNGTNTVTLFTSGTVTNSGQVVIGNLPSATVGELGVLNQGVFQNNTGGSIRIDRTTSHGFQNRGTGTITNSATITIGQSASIGGIGILSNGTASFSNTAGGYIQIDNTGNNGIGLLGGTFTNAAVVRIGSFSTIGGIGIISQGNSVVTNAIGGDISVNRTDGQGVVCFGTFVNSSTLTIGNIAFSGQDNIENQGTFTNTATGVINADRTANRNGNGIWNAANTFTNSGTISIRFLSITAGNGILNTGTSFANLAGGRIQLDRVMRGVANRTTFTNGGEIRMGDNAPLGDRGIQNTTNNALFTNLAGGVISIGQTAYTRDGIINEAGNTFTNSGTISIGTSGSIAGNGITNAGTLNNGACATLTVLDNVANSGSFTNAGLLTVSTTQSHTNTGSFINTGDIAYPQGNPIPNVTNNNPFDAPVIGCVSGISPALQLGENSSQLTIGTTWYKDPALTQPAGSYDQASNTFTPSNLTAGSTTILYFSVTYGANACTKIESVTVTLNPQVTASISPESAILTCASPTVSLTASGGTSYIWDDNSTNPVRTVSAAGTYSVTVLSGSACSAVANTTVISNTATIAVSNPTVAIATQGVAFSQSFSALGGATPYSFSVVEGSLPAGLSLATTGELSGTPTQAGSYSITVQATDANGCVGAGAYNLTVNAAIPTIADLAASPAVVCVGSPVTFTATIGNLTGSYAYTLTNGSSTTMGTASNMVFSQNLTASGSGVQTFTLTVSSSSQTASAITSLTVNSLPTSASLTSGTLTCANTSVTLTALATGGASYTLLGGPASQSNTTGEFMVSTAGTYTAIIANASGCTATATATVTSNTATPMATLTASSTTACAPASITLTAGGGTSYTFSAGATQISTSNRAIVTQSGSYSVTVSNAAGCTATNSVSVTVNTPPAAPTLTGVSRTVTQSTTPLPLGHFVMADNGNTLSFSGVSGAIANPPTANISQAGVQSFSVSQTSASGCVSSATAFTITVQQSATTTPASQTVCRSSAVVLSATTTGTRYEWYKNGTSAPFKLTEIASIQRGTATSSLTVVSIQTTASYYAKVFQANGSFTFDGPFVVTVNYGCIAPGARVSAAEVAEVPLRVVLTPNPLVDGQLRAVVTGAAGQPLSVQLLDLRGEVVREQTWSAADEAQGVAWDLSQRPAGLYLLRATASGQSATLKVVKP